MARHRNVRMMLGCDDGKLKYYKKELLRYRNKIQFLFP